MSSVFAGFGAIAQAATFAADECSGRSFSPERLQRSKRDRGGSVGAAGEDARRTADETPALQPRPWLPDGVVDSKVFIEATLWKLNV